MAKQRLLKFPEGFLWGTATASHQNEGSNTNNQWYRWEQQGHILTGETCGEANNWWQNTDADFDLAEQMENNALRLSLEWSRIEPREGRWDSAAIERYRIMLKDLRRRHIKPVVTLHHFTEPLWFFEQGGFAREENIRYFVRYASYVVQRLHDLCDFWITINEPNVYAAQGYALGEREDGFQGLRGVALNDILGDGIGAADFAEHAGAASWYALLRDGIKLDQPKVGTPAFVPLEIIQ